MRNSIHSIRLVVSLLLGILWSVLPVADTAHAASASLPIVTPSQTYLASNAVICSYDKSVKTRMVYTSLTSLPVTELMPYLPQTIASAREDLRKQKRENIPSVLPSPSLTPNSSQQETPPLSPTTTTPSPEPSVEATSTESVPAPGAQLNAEVLFSLVNAHRVSIGLPPFLQDPRVQDVANSRAPELDYEIYGGRGMHAGFNARNLGYFATENMISMPTEEAALAWWLNSSVHRSAIEGNYQYAAVGCGGRSCAMIFTNFASQ